METTFESKDEPSLSWPAPLEWQPGLRNDIKTLKAVEHVTGTMIGSATFERKEDGSLRLKQCSFVSREHDFPLRVPS